VNSGPGGIAEARDRGADPALEVGRAPRRAQHVGREAVDRLARDPGLVAGGPGVLDQRPRVVAGVVRGRDADRRGHEQLVVADPVADRQRRRDPRRHRLGLGGARVAQHQHQLVGAGPRQQRAADPGVGISDRLIEPQVEIGAAHVLDHPRGDGPAQLVAIGRLTARHPPSAMPMLISVTGVPAARVGSTRRKNRCRNARLGRPVDRRRTPAGRSGARPRAAR
jgi:hypothetical protein